MLTALISMADWIPNLDASPPPRATYRLFRLSGTSSAVQSLRLTPKYPLMAAHTNNATTRPHFEHTAPILHSKMLCNHACPAL